MSNEIQQLYVGMPKYVQITLHTYTVDALSAFQVIQCGGNEFTDVYKPNESSSFYATWAGKHCKINELKKESQENSSSLTQTLPPRLENI